MRRLTATERAKFPEVLAHARALSRRRKARPGRGPNPNGAVLYRGPSVLDGAPIVVVATGLRASSGNAKTGALVQTWILREDLTPQDAVRSGADASICGACPMRSLDGRGFKRRACYVQMQAPAGVYRCYTTGRGYIDARDPRIAAALLRGRKLRLGSYGDPAAVPAELLLAWASAASRTNGYTHQSAHARFDVRVLDVCMLSADTGADVERADALGARYFRVLPRGATVPNGVVLCPASAEAGRRTTCERCMLCGGRAVRARSIAIPAHGSGAGAVALRVLD